MTTTAFEDVVSDFDFLEDWEDRYRYVIEQGKAMAPLQEAMKVPANKVNGCASQVWLKHRVENGCWFFDGESDAMIVNGLIAILRKLYNGLTLQEALSIDAQAELVRIDLAEHLSAQRSNGLSAMIVRIQALLRSEIT
ncbi:MAG: SufE family protein [Aestuariivita sp.]|nr:SufE family protein [Aestuariivita sp.]MCY4347045.1 SufE family protein [Aestuariivita sp.]